MWRRALIIVTTVVLGGCGTGEGGDDPAGPAAGDGGARLQVVAGFHPLAELVAVLGGDRVAVQDVTPSGAEPHDVELTSDEVDALEDADLVVVLGGGFQPAVEEAAARRSGPVVDVLAGLSGVVEGGDGHDDDHGDHEGDPHVWLDPLAMADVADLVAAGLEEADPGGGPAYRAAAAGWREEMAALHDRYETTLGSCERRTVVVGHASFGWLAARYGLEQHGIEGADPHGEPDPRWLDRLAELLEAEGLTTVFHEPGAADSAARTLARETGAALAVLDSLERAPTSDGPSGYAARMDANLAALASALGCGAAP